MTFIYRFCRSIRSGCAPIAAVIGFSCLLTFIFILYQPTFGPGLSQRLGWQSWDVISLDNTLASSNSNSNNNEAAESSPDLPEGVDWWNVTTTQDTVDSASLPLDVWAPLLPHDTGCAFPFCCHDSLSNPLLQYQKYPSYDASSDQT